MQLSLVSSKASAVTAMILVPARGQVRRMVRTASMPPCVVERVGERGGR